MVFNMNNEWLNLQYLSYALEVEKAGSISKAAKNLYLNQPNLSKAIKELESMVGISIFERTTKGVSATTEDGRILLEYAQNILTQVEDMRSYFQTVNPIRTTFRISIPRASYIAEAFASFINEIDDMDAFNIAFQETDFAQAIKSVTADGYNLAVVRYRTLYEKYFLTVLLDEKLEYQEILKADSVVIINKRNILADRAVLELSDLDDMIEITNNDFAIPRHSSAETLKADFLSHSRKQILAYERGSQFDLLAHNPNAFMWTSPMPKDLLIRNSLLQKKCNTDAMEFKDLLIYQKGHTFDELEQLFLKHLEQVKESVCTNIIC